MGAAVATQHCIALLNIPVRQTSTEQLFRASKKSCHKSGLRRLRVTHQLYEVVFVDGLPAGVPVDLNWQLLLIPPGWLAPDNTWGVLVRRLFTGGLHQAQRGVCLLGTDSKYGDRYEAEVSAA
jgi:hypothetical protein